MDYLPNLYTIEYREPEWLDRVRNRVRNRDRDRVRNRVRDSNFLWKCLFSLGSVSG